MNNRARTLLAAFILIVSKPALGGMESGELQELSEGLIDSFCGNNLYRECLGLSKGVCSKSIRAANDACPFKYYESLGEEFIDAPCITEKFFDIADVPDHVAMSCDEFLESELELMREKVNKTMPNKALENDAQ